MPNELIVEKIDIKENEWYQNLLEELKSVIVEKRFNASCELLEGKWLLGKRICEEQGNFERFGYGEKAVELLSRDLEISRPHLYKCIEFYRKFSLENFEKVIEALPGGKNISWFKVCQEVLPEPRERKEEEERRIKQQAVCLHSRLKCLDCGKIIEYPEGIQKFLEK